MKMGTTASPWRYDAVAADAIRPNNQRRTAILRYASRAAAFSISLVVRLLSIEALSINPGIDVMGRSGRRRSSMRRCQGELRDSTWNVLW